MGSNPAAPTNKTKDLGRSFQTAHFFFGLFSNVFGNTIVIASAGNKKAPPLTTGPGNWGFFYEEYRSCDRVSEIFYAPAHKHHNCPSGLAQKKCPDRAKQPGLET